jgi:TPR repeat protein
MDAQRCQNHGPVRLLVPLLEFNQDYGKAREWCQKAADAGVAVAMTNLGSLYQNGRGGAQDYAKAREWYQKAADAGNTDGMFNLGWLYQKGWGVAQDYAKAHEWYQKAADAGVAVAMTNLGSLYVDGRGVAQDYAKAFTSSRRSSLSMSPLSCTICKRSYRRLP